MILGEGARGKINHFNFFVETGFKPVSTVITTHYCKTVETQNLASLQPQHTKLK